MKQIYPLKAGAGASIAEVGGKGYNLIKMLDAQLQVPSGFVLTVSFFSPWFSELEASPQWASFLSAPPEDLKKSCDSLKEVCLSFGFDEQQEAQLAPFWEKYDEGALFAVRSSSPEEDLEGSSFAGIYETVLGVSRETFVDAVRTAFLSCLDYRIASYKREKGFSISEPKIAVVVQKQIASDIAGVGFSVNPLNNCYDEAVFTGSWGLGETVVSGLVSPDCFTVEKHTKKLLEQTLGEKETALWLLPGGGTQERRDPRHGEYCLTEEQVIALTEQMNRVEEYYGVPMDIEWAFEGGALHLLQARPITTHHPLANNLLTQPGQPKRLYLDVTISVQGLIDPLSPLGASAFVLLLKKFGIELAGATFGKDIDRDPFGVGGGRLYFNLANIIRLAGKEKIVALFTQMDDLSSKALANMDTTQLKGKISKFRLVFGALLRIYPRVRNVLRSFRDPEGTLERWHRRWAEVKAECIKIEETTPHLEEYLSDLTEFILRFIARETIIMFISAKISMSRIRKLFPNPTEEVAQWLSRLDLSLPGNVTMEMGLEMYRLSCLLPKEEGLTPKDLALRLKEKTLPAEFIEAWEVFIGEYGHRANKEIDVAAPRYFEQPDILYQQMLSYAHLDPKDSPLVRHEAAQVTRNEARDALAAQLEKSPRKKKKFLKLHHVVETLGGARETHKFVIVHAFAQMRARILKEAKKLLHADRMDAIDDVFYLSIPQLQRALDDANVNVREQIVAGKRETAQSGQCKQIAPLIDSRGRFYRAPPRKVGPGEIAGQGVSPGIITAQLKVLHSPDEKPLLPGEILVARATDPSWTPLFINASGIILEVGGPLQHGALVAREYGKPCIAGVQNATELFKDGETVELDGSSGIIRKLPSS